VKMKKPDFVGKPALEKLKAQGLLQKLVGIELEGRRVPRHAMVIESEGRPVGRVTSGTHSPTLDRPIGLGYVETALASSGTPIDVVAGDTRLRARVAPLPFYRHGSRRTA